MTWGELAEAFLNKAGESNSDVEMLDALCNHADEIRLKNCTYEKHEDRIYTIVRYSWRDGTYTRSFWKKRDAVSFVSKDANAVEQEFESQGKGFVKAKSEDGMKIEMYVEESNVYYEWNIKESSVE